MLTIDKTMTDAKSLLNVLALDAEPTPCTPDALASAFVRCFVRRAARRTRRRMLDKRLFLIPGLL